MYPRRLRLCRQGRRHRRQPAQPAAGKIDRPWPWVGFALPPGKARRTSGTRPLRPRPDSQRCSTTPAPPVRVILIGSLLHATRPYGPRPRVKILFGASLISSQYFHS